MSKLALSFSFFASEHQHEVNSLVEWTRVNRPVQYLCGTIVSARIRTCSQGPNAENMRNVSSHQNYTVARTVLFALVGVFFFQSRTSRVLCFTWFGWWWFVDGTYTFAFLPHKPGKYEIHTGISVRWVFRSYLDDHWYTIFENTVLFLDLKIIRYWNSSFWLDFVKSLILNVWYRLYL